jgi:Na+/H+-translocating membrane pyrophosphatase
MSAIPQERLTFELPFINYKLPLLLFQTQVDEMRAFTQTVHDTDARTLENMLGTITKIVPIVLCIIAAIALSPIWFPIATISSFLLGPITWIAAGVTGVAIWEVVQRVFTSFRQQHPAIVDYVAAKIVSLQRREDPNGPL